MSRSEVNQQTAKATLTQMLNVVFQRMEADSVYVEVKPIMVTDVLGLPRINPQDTGSLTAVVQVGLLRRAPETFYGSRVPAARGNTKTAAPHMGEESSATPAAAEAISGGGGSSTATPSTAAAGVAAASSRASAGGSDAGGSVTSQFIADAASRTAVLQRDAFLVFRALCKLSIRTNDSATSNDPTAVRGKVLALELVKVLLENSGPVFRRTDKFLAAIRQYLCLSLIKNSASPLPAAQSLSASIFMSLLARFRASLKAEVGVFFPMIMLKPFEGTTPENYSRLAVVLRCLKELCHDGQLLLDLFVNFDCDLDSSNLFERLVNSLVRQAQQPVQVRGGGRGVYSSSALATAEQGLRQEALLCLVNAMEAIWTWYRRNISGNTGFAAAADDDGGIDDADLAAAAAAAAAAAGGTGADASMAGGGGPEDLVAKRAYKLKFQQGIALFNKKPKKGVEFLHREGMLGAFPEDVASFLTRAEGLDKTTIGDYLGERDEYCLKVMHAYVDAMDFTNMEFDAAIRAFLQGFRLPGEAQKIDRLMEKFAERFVKCNPVSFKSADVAYVLAYSVIMLNTDAHNPQVKNKMSKAAFLKNNRGINDGADLPEDFMSALYDRIVNQEIKMKDDGGAAGAGAAAPQEAGGLAAPARALFNTLLGLMGGRGQAVSSGPSDAAIRATLDYLHQRAASATTVTVTEPDAVRPLMEVIWAPLLGALSTLYDEYGDPKLVTVCLSGFVAAACLSAQTGMTHLRDVFLNALCNFTHLHSPATMRYKNALAFKYVLRVAETVGDHLQERWVDVLRCISRWELLQQIASGMPTDAALFRPPEDNRGSIKVRSVQGAGWAKSVNRDRRANWAMFGPSSRGGAHHHHPHHPHPGDPSAVPAEVINSVDSGDLNRVFLTSGQLNSEAIVEFVKALTAVSADELRDPRAPRVFSLTKIVEVAHFNMTRIRLVWSRIWAVLSEYFIAVGCHANLSLAMYAVDALRQLAMKFLERDELANYTFQNDFLRPFVVVMRQSQAVEIRELIIRCLSQMILARVTNVKSGWKSMFMVFTTAANDRDPMIVRLAFDTIEKIVREHFTHITETETTTFTDCVNCLIAFTNNPHSLDVALNSIAFLRFCAMKLAEGAIGDVNMLPEGTLPPQALQHHPLRVLRFIDRDEHVYFWFPLLAGLSELTFDPRQEIRHSALEVLFDILRFHGGSFAQSFWVRIFDSVLLPIFDHVRAEVSSSSRGVTDTTTFTSEKRRQQEDHWLYETCTRCLQHLVDLFVQFYDEAFTLLSRLLDLLRGFMVRSHQSLAAVGVAAFVRLAVNAGPIMNETCWDEVIAALLALLEETSPDNAVISSEITPASAGNSPSSHVVLPAGGSGSSGGGAGGGGRGPLFTLREGVGARRLAKFRCQAATQLLLVQGCSEVYAKASQSLPPGAVRGLLDALDLMHRHAHATDMDLDLRRRLADRVAEDKAVADPPLLRLEVEAAAAYLSVNLAITANAGQPGASPDAVALARLTNSQERLVRLCLTTLARYTLGNHPQHVAVMPQPRYIVVGRTSSGAPVLMAPPAVEFASFSPLALSSLVALGELEEATFRRYLGELFPLLTQLIRADYAPPDVHRALSTLFARRVQPMVLAATTGLAAGLGASGAAAAAGSFGGLGGRA
ncbi:hypothetical protein VOLCADRAFT_80189 [Volvox carteri f. nagariensis]|uniref:SEC7 domain-containing protein n=1 Tax=Volvox carteri f. nagariensis TaxID=3068 RepID=D8TPX3_VOLCA|nr:uncharacterized protein VOLCADRAFT_80189 [Volvox carteri f. nagariensis]EFJ50436.1 hypothetical protein VOLCADRAFT_80189 [Volvox carteri f. nagariensis]|eukprot:XP_002948561.1 hypothetical protein VOLCADRAFT_80189 [Volvox carteri f. nagariensis]